MDTLRFRGTTVALVTPFEEGGALDLETYRTHIEAQIEGGVEVLLPCGTTGESATMSAEEQFEVISKAVEVADGRAAVMGGAGTNATSEAVRLASAVQEAGADAVLSVCPYYNKPTQDGLYAHFEAIARAIEIPLFVYNVPGRTSSNIAPETLLRLAEIENVVGVKEASGDLDQIMQILAGRPDGFLVLAGDDAITLPVLALGGDGVVSVAANEAPDLMSDMVRAGLAGDFRRARDLHYRLLPLMGVNFIETNPIPVKTAMELLGRMKAHFRLPLVPMQPENRERLRETLTDVGLL